MATRRVFPYPDERALEDVAFGHGRTPTLFLPFLLPVWSVEVEATITEAEPYGLIDRHLERGIAAGRLDTAADLARFFSLDDALVARALRVLAGIGHVTETPDGRVALTRIGFESVRDKVRYVEKRRDRRRLYFDAFGSRPLTRRYYDSSVVTLLSGPELIAVTDRYFRMPLSLRGFRDEALTELAGQRDRERFNLPHRIDSPSRVGAPECVFLPLLVIGTADRLFAYGQAADTADDDISAICERSPEIGETVRARHGLADRSEAKARDWLRKRGLDPVEPTRLGNGMLRVVLRTADFGGKGALSLNRLGSFVVQDTDFFQLWCTDERTRRRALLTRMDAYVSARSRLWRDDLETQLSRLTAQLDLEPLTLDGLAGLAHRLGYGSLAAQLSGSQS
jgi:hypothetical protein